MASYIDTCNDIDVHNYLRLNYLHNILDDKASKMYRISEKSIASTFLKACNLLRNE